MIQPMIFYTHWLALLHDTFHVKMFPTRSVAELRPFTHNHTQSKIYNTHTHQRKCGLGPVSTLSVPDRLF